MFVPIFKKRGQPDPPGVEDEFERLMVSSARILDRLTAQPQVSDEEIRVVFQDAIDAGLGWTRLSEGGYYPSVSKPYSDAMAKIIFGMKENDNSHVNAGADQMIQVAQRFARGT